ncbi:MAG: hypothetical protein HOY78_18065 [Saccharothrix sp.]|nr:hypothetical protein [Saccharothrix sp.]
MTLPTRRRAFTRLRTPIIGLVAAAIAVLAPGVAHAAPPANDDFDQATTITALPFSTTQDTAQATKAADDPTDCYYWGTHSVWFRYTATEDALLRTTVSSTGQTPLVAVYTGGRGALTPVPGSCTRDFPTRAFPVTAGTTYYIEVFEYYYGGQVDFRLAAVPPAPNDDVAAAAPVVLPAELTGDLSVASAEPDEVPSSCEQGLDRSVWYRYTPERTRSVAVMTGYGSPSITVYQGATPDALSEVDCVDSYSGYSAVFTATAGRTYFVKLAKGAERASEFSLSLVNAPAVHPAAWPYPNTPSTFDDVQFTVYSGDPLNRPLVGGEVKFGDGTSAPITGDTLVHRYAADGEYRVEVTGTTSDGRTGTSVRTLVVETHDVGLSGFTVPASARAGQTKPIKVTLANGTARAETVEVELLRLSESGYYTTVGTLKQWLAGGSRVELPFAYTYTAADVAAGKVTFKARVDIDGRYDGDDNPADNEVVAVTTTVRAGATTADDPHCCR